MAENQPPTIVEGATTGDVDDEIPVAAKSAEDRKAQAALSSLDAPREDESSTKDVDVEAVRKAMERLGGSATANGTVAKKDEEKKVVKKMVKVDPADVALLVCLVQEGQLPWLLFSLHLYHMAILDARTGAIPVNVELFKEQLLSVFSVTDTYVHQQFRLSLTRLFHPG